MLKVCTSMTFHYLTSSVADGKSSKKKKNTGKTTKMLSLYKCVDLIVMCLLMEAAGDCHHQRTSACTDQEKKEATVVTGHLHGSNKTNHKLTSLLATGQRPPIHKFRTKRASGNI